MLLTLSAPLSAGDLGYLLHKNPARVHDFNLPFGRAYVFFPRRAPEGHATAGLLLDIDSVEVLRGGSGALEDYVSDRPYVASSFLSVAISRVLGTALNGRSRERQELAETAIAWTARMPAVPVAGGEALLGEIFEPLGYRVEARRIALDEQFPEWGEGRHFAVTIQGEKRLSELLTHLYVLVPVLDAGKHYWVGESEVDKLLRAGEGWLQSHPARDKIVHRYLEHRGTLTRLALARLDEEDGDADERIETATEDEARMEQPLRLWQQRIGVALALLRGRGARRVLDLA